MSNFVKTNEKYGSGFVVEEYNGAWSLVEAKEGKEKVYTQWCKRIFKNEVQDKAWPIKVSLGDTQKEALDNLRRAAEIIKKGPQKKEEKVDDDIPF